MMRRPSLAIAAIAGLSLDTLVFRLMRTHGLRSFPDGFTKRRFEAAAVPRSDYRRRTRLYVGNGARERQRRIRQDAQVRQLTCHLTTSYAAANGLDTVKPRHIFGASQ